MNETDNFAHIIKVMRDREEQQRRFYEAQLRFDEAQRRVAAVVLGHRARAPVLRHLRVRLQHPVRDL